jgi:ACS family tartrate transporter-like MFS transporter
MANPDSYFEPLTPPTNSALDRARIKAYWRLLPLLFLSYLIAYVDRSNVGILKLKMVDDLPNFNNDIFGFGMGIFFAGYCLLEIPGTLIVERWSARKWICRIMITWGIFAAMTAMVTKPWHFYTIRFLLGLAEAGFYPGVIVYLTHWFPKRDRSRALAYFFMAGPLAQLISPKLTNLLLPIGTTETIKGVVVDHNLAYLLMPGPPSQGISPMLTNFLLPIGNTELIQGIVTHHDKIWGLVGWQWAFIAWGIPAVILGALVLMYLTDRPSQAKWLKDDERQALEAELAREKAEHPASKHMTVWEALSNRKVLTLTAAYFFVVTGNYGVEFFMPSIFKAWYGLSIDDVTSLVLLPPIGSLIGQFFVGWNSDRTGERRLHTVVPIFMGASVLLALVIVKSPPIWLTVILLTVAMAGLKAYLPAFWSLPTLFLTESAAASSIGLINSVGNLGGWIGPWMMGRIEHITGSFRGGLAYLAVSMTISATIILLLGLGKRVAKPKPESQPETLAKVLPETT